MSRRPLVTVVIPCHNLAAYVGEAIESALAQTYEPVEVLVIDDGSADDSASVIAPYADRVRIITQEETGLERAYNRAVSEAGGEYLARLDADDVLEPRYLEELWGALEGSPDAAYAYCRPQLFGHARARCGACPSVRTS